MQIERDIQQLEKVYNDIKERTEKLIHTQSLDWYIQTLGILCNYLPYVNEQMARSKRCLNQRKKLAYESVADEFQNKKHFSPMLIKDYVNTICQQEHYWYDLSERISRTLVHSIDSLRTIISALKEEFKISNYH